MDLDLGRPEFRSSFRLGFLLQWPTPLTTAMFPILVVVYVRLATSEEAEMQPRLGDLYARYAARTPRFVPSWRQPVPPSGVAP